MHINDLPTEILHHILGHAAELNAALGVAYTYGLSQVEPRQKTTSKVTRAIRGPVSADSRRWDAVSAVRQTCKSWHQWALDQAVRDLYVRRWRGSERWSNLTIKRHMYNVYEMIHDPSGIFVYRNPYEELEQTGKLFATYPAMTSSVRRVWFSGFFTSEAEALIFKVLRSCRSLTSISIPWTLLRHGSADDWVHTLGIHASDDIALESLELQAVCLPEQLTDLSATKIDRQPLLNPRVDFSRLKRLKLFGNTTFMPVCDSDLRAISRTATNLEEFHVTCLSTVTIRGVLDIVRAAQSTLRVLDYSPRSQDGFYHPDPGMVDPDEHICDILTKCPKLKDLSISVPSVCPHIFSRDDVPWQGECQIRALRLCGQHHHHHAREASSTQPPQQSTAQSNATRLQHLLNEARELIDNRRRTRHPDLFVELFFADCIFDPHAHVVHGDFALAQILSNGLWPEDKTRSSKGPYGSTGLYGKGEGDWDVVREEEWFEALERGWTAL